MSARVLFYVQHLLGIGHLKRAATLARAMTQAGLDVTVVSGGETVSVLDSSGMNFVQLPSLRAADRSFDRLVDEDGKPVDDSLQKNRRDKLLEMFKDLRPDILIIELYPFGRGMMRFELLPLLEAANSTVPKPQIVCSVRDILVQKNRPWRDAEMVADARKNFDHILVHGDPDFIKFGDTFSPADELSDMLHYTGYVVGQEARQPADSDFGTDEVIVSSGSGAVAEKLLRIALEARQFSNLSNLTWRFLVGHSLPDEIFKDIQSNASSIEGVVVERARPDFVEILKNCRLSISQGGYNTVMEVLATGAPGIAVPYAGGNETEQTMRIRLLAERNLLQMIPEDNLTVENLVEKIDQVGSREVENLININLGGAEKTANLIRQWCG